MSGINFNTSYNELAKKIKNNLQQSANKEQESENSQTGSESSAQTENQNMSAESLDMLVYEASMNMVSVQKTQTITLKGITFTVQKNKNSSLSYSLNGNNLIINAKNCVISVKKITNSKLNITLNGSNNVMNTDVALKLTNNSQNSVINGSKKADSITNKAKNVIINAGDGNDTIKNTAESAIVLGGKGNDTVTNSGKNSIISGGEGNDKLTNEKNGTGSKIYGDEGNDTITNKGKATIYGGSGNDTISNDKNAKNSVIYGNAGNDKITNKADSTKIYGQNGNDTITNSGKGTTIQGGAGYDTIGGVLYKDNKKFTGQNEVNGKFYKDGKILAKGEMELDGVTYSVLNGIGTVKFKTVITVEHKNYPKRAEISYKNYETGEISEISFIEKKYINGYIKDNFIRTIKANDGETLEYIENAGGNFDVFAIHTDKDDNKTYYTNSGTLASYVYVKEIRDGKEVSVFIKNGKPYTGTYGIREDSIMNFKEGLPSSGWVSDTYFNKDGKLASGYNEIENENGEVEKLYFINGKLANGDVKVKNENGEEEYIKFQNGKAYTGLYNFVYYVDGKKAQGWQDVTENGITQTLYFAGGKKAQGWQNVIENGITKTLYFAGGEKAQGWQNVTENGKTKTLYFADGEKAQGWQDVIENGKTERLYFVDGRKANGDEKVKNENEEAKRAAEEQARLEAEEAKKAAEEQARLEAEEAAKKAAEEQARLEAEEAKKAAEEQARLEAEEAKKAAEEQARLEAEEAKKAAEEQARLEAEEAKKAAEEQARLEAEEAKKAAEEQARLEAEEAKKAAEEQARLEAEEAKRAAEEQARLEAEEAKKAAEEQARLEAEEAKKAAEEQARLEAEEAKKAAEEQARLEAEEAKRAAEEQARLEAEAAKKAAEDGKKAQGWQEVTENGKTERFYFVNGRKHSGDVTVKNENGTDEIMHFENGKVYTGKVFYTNNDYLYFVESRLAQGWQDVTENGKTETLYFVDGLEAHLKEIEIDGETYMFYKGKFADKVTINNNYYENGKIAEKRKDIPDDNTNPPKDVTPPAADDETEDLHGDLIYIDNEIADNIADGINFYSNGQVGGTGFYDGLYYADGIWGTGRASDGNYYEYGQYLFDSTNHDEYGRLYIQDFDGTYSVANRTVVDGKYYLAGKPGPGIDENGVKYNSKGISETLINTAQAMTNSVWTATKNVMNKASELLTNNKNELPPLVRSMLNSVVTACENFNAKLNDNNKLNEISNDIKALSNTLNNVKQTLESQGTLNGVLDEFSTEVTNTVSNVKDIETFIAEHINDDIEIIDNSIETIEIPESVYNQMKADPIKPSAAEKIINIATDQIKLFGHKYMVDEYKSSNSLFKFDKPWDNVSIKGFDIRNGLNYVNYIIECFKGTLSSHLFTFDGTTFEITGTNSQMTIDEQGRLESLVLDVGDGRTDTITIDWKDEYSCDIQYYNETIKNDSSLNFTYNVNVENGIINGEEIHSVCPSSLLTIKADMVIDENQNVTSYMQKIKFRGEGFTTRRLSKNGIMEVTSYNPRKNNQRESSKSQINASIYSSKCDEILLTENRKDDFLNYKSKLNSYGGFDSTCRSNYSDMTCSEITSTDGNGQVIELKSTSTKNGSKTIRTIKNGIETITTDGEMRSGYPKKAEDATTSPVTIKREIASYDITKNNLKQEIEIIPEDKGLPYPASMTQEEKNAEALKILNWKVQRGEINLQKYDDSGEGTYSLTFNDGSKIACDFEYDKKNNKITKVTDCPSEALIYLREWQLNNDSSSKVSDGSVGTFAQSHMVGDCVALSMINCLPDSEIKNRINEIENGYVVTFPGNCTDLEGNIIVKGPFTVGVTYNELYGSNLATGDLDIAIIELARNKIYNKYLDALQSAEAALAGEYDLRYKVYQKDERKEYILQDLEKIQPNAGGFIATEYNLFNSDVKACTSLIRFFIANCMRDDGLGLKEIMATGAMAGFIEAAISTAVASVGRTIPAFLPITFTLGLADAYAWENNVLTDFVEATEHYALLISMVKNNLNSLVNTTVSTASKETGDIFISETIKEKYSMDSVDLGGGDKNKIVFKNIGEDEYTKITCSHAYKVVRVEGADVENGPFVVVENPHLSNTEIKIPADLFLSVFDFSLDKEIFDKCMNAQIA